MLRPIASLQVVLPYLRAKLDRLYAQHSRGREALPGLGAFQRRCTPSLTP